MPWSFWWLVWSSLGASVISSAYKRCSDHSKDSKVVCQEPGTKAKYLFPAVPQNPRFISGIYMSLTFFYSKGLKKNSPLGRIFKKLETLFGVFLPGSALSPLPGTGRECHFHSTVLGHIVGLLHLQVQAWGFLHQKSSLVHRGLGAVSWVSIQWY